MSSRKAVSVIVGLAFGLATLSVVASAATTTETETAAKPAAVDFTPEYMANADKIALGGEIWQDQCRHCHGRSAYPGKAPKLKPRRYKPDFVYKRITKGFRKMPAWEDVYNQDERMAIVAYIMSDSFSP